MSLKEKLGALFDKTLELFDFTELFEGSSCLYVVKNSQSTSKLNVDEFTFALLGEVVYGTLEPRITSPIILNLQLIFLDLYKQFEHLNVNEQQCSIIWDFNVLVVPK